MPSTTEAPEVAETEDLAARIERKLEADREPEAAVETPETTEPETPPEEPPAFAEEDYDPSVPPEQPKPQTEQEKQDAEALSRLKEEQGIDLSHKFNSDYDLAASYVQLEKRLGERDEDANAWREFAKDPQRYLEHFAPPQAQPEPETGKSDVPEWNPKWLQQVTEVDGEIKPLPGAEPDVVNKLVRAQRYAQEQMFDRTFNPQEQPTIDPQQIDQLVEQRVQAQLGQYTAQMEDMNEAQRIIDRSAQWMFEDPQNPDPKSRTLTNRGKAYSQYVNQAYASGMTNARDVDQWSRDQMELAASRATRSARPAKTQTRSSAEPAIEDAGPKYDTKQPLEANIMQRLKAAGLKPR